VTAPTPPTLIAPSAYGGADDGGLVFFIGRVDFDFGTEARRDTFKQQMPPALFKFENNVIVEVISEVDMDEAAIAEKLQQHYFPVPPNPFDPRQMVAYLKKRPDEARSLIWTLNLELTPIYSVEPVGPFADQVYDTLVKMLEGQSQAEGNMAYVERVSVPAVLSGQSVRLFSGQVVSQLLVDARRGMYSWQTNDLIQKALDAVAKEHAAAAAAAEAREQAPLSPPDLVVLRNVMREVLNKLYYQYRNLGITSPDRALNFAATNLFQLTTVITSAFLDPKGSKTLERVDVVKSPYGRVDSDCWDVQLKFLDPNNTNRAYSVFRFTLDVSDKLPVTMGPIVDYISVT
jgi:cyanobactin maturation PatA/PatG family protease